MSDETPPIPPAEPDPIPLTPVPPARPRPEPRPDDRDDYGPPRRRAAGGGSATPWIIGGVVLLSMCVMGSLVVIVCIAAITALGTNANETFEKIGTDMGPASAPAPNVGREVKTANGPDY